MLSALLCNVQDDKMEFATWMDGFCPPLSGALLGQRIGFTVDEYLLILHVRQQRCPDLGAL